MKTAFKLSKVNKNYRGHTILCDVSLDVPYGKVGLFGKNGAGKTSLLRLLAKFEQPDSGEVFYGDSIQSVTLCSSCISYPEILTLDNIVHLYAKEGVIDATNFDRFLSLFGLETYRHHLINTLSAGSVQKLRLAVALSSKRDVLLLDEPLNGLDERSAQLAIAEIIADSRAMIIVDHECRFNAYLNGKLEIEASACTLKM